MGQDAPSFVTKRSDVRMGQDAPSSVTKRSDVRMGQDAPSSVTKRSDVRMGQGQPSFVTKRSDKCMLREEEEEEEEEESRGECDVDDVERSFADKLSSPVIGSAAKAASARRPLGRMALNRDREVRGSGSSFSGKRMRSMQPSKTGTT